MREYIHRFYRRQMRAEGLVSFQVRLKESDLFIWALRDLREEALDSLTRHRSLLEEFIARQPLFAATFRPYAVPVEAPEIVRRMAEAAARAHVGPMAAVAGAVAEMVGLDLLPLSPELMVENGGDIFLSSRSERRIGIFAGESPFSGRLALVVAPTPPQGLGICTSSATVGPSYSAGAADAALVVAESASLADAAATALGNRVKSPEDMEEALAYVAGLEGVTGCLVIMGDRLGVRGDLRLERAG
ncbi:UPF0280 family protein [Candidatus Solincola tengchongensis]|uniref:UPF0280 family protein n=1 Tax=Candidatus Solincola tengchongensis TaxID=2900693 RepID=UPI00257FC023|nr:UPF0280 family protein [Candidatus Solincola tengchongensis]